VWFQQRQAAEGRRVHRLGKDLSDRAQRKADGSPYTLTICCTNAHTDCNAKHRRAFCEADDHSVC
jgi:hypothetical protein